MLYTNKIKNWFLPSPKSASLNHKKMALSMNNDPFFYDSNLPPLASAKNNSSSCLRITIERQKTGLTPEIRLKEKSSLWDRPFKQALIYSILFHVLAFGFIRVKFLQIYDILQPLPPVEVVIDQELHVGQTLAVDGIDSQDRPKYYAPSVFSYPTSEVAWNGAENENGVNFQEKKMIFPIRFYPLKMEINSQLEKLILMEDGSKLFKEKGDQAQELAPKLPITFFSIAYHVKVAGESGKIISWRRKKELLDKKLQAYADKIIETIRFAPATKKITKGKIVLTFDASGDEVEELLIHD